MTESVTISLEHFKELEYYKKQYEVLQDIRKDLTEIIKDKSFTLDNPKDNKIFNIYSKIIKKEMNQ